MGIEKVGSLGGRYTVYRDPYAPANSIIIGHKGKSLLDTGYIYAPYVPLQLDSNVTESIQLRSGEGDYDYDMLRKWLITVSMVELTVDGVVTFDPNQLR